MAHKKAGGSTKNGRDSNSQRRGIKVYGGQVVQTGAIIIRQVGSSFHAGVNVGTGKDFTLYAKVNGIVTYQALGKDKRQVHVITAPTP